MTSPEFLVGGLVVGFIVNILASYMKERIDRQLAQYSASRKEKNEALTEQRRVAIARMVASDDELAYMRYRELRISIGAMGYAIILIMHFLGFALGGIVFKLEPDEHSPWLRRYIFVAGLGLMIFFGAKGRALARSGQRLYADIRAAMHLRQSTLFNLQENGTLIRKTESEDSLPQASTPPAPADISITTRKA